MNKSLNGAPCSAVLPSGFVGELPIIIELRSPLWCECGLCELWGCVWEWWYGFVIQAPCCDCTIGGGVLQAAVSAKLHIFGFDAGRGMPQSLLAWFFEPGTISSFIPPLASCYWIVQKWTIYNLEMFMKLQCCSWERELTTPCTQHCMMMVIRRMLQMMLTCYLINVQKN